MSDTTEFELLMDAFKALSVSKEAAGKIDTLKTELKKIQEEARKEGASKEKQEEAERYSNAIATAATELAKGIISAQEAFNNKDGYAGAAAIMDICGSISSATGKILGGAAAIGDPLVSAIFSIFSMVLNLFKKEEPSLLDKIEGLIRDIIAEEKEAELDVALETLKMHMNDIIKMDLMWDLPNFLPKTGSSDVERNILMAKAWLKNIKNQEASGWDDVLKKLCDVQILYVQMLTLSLVRTVSFKPTALKDKPQEVKDTLQYSLQNASESTEILSQQEITKYKNNLIYIKNKLKPQIDGQREFLDEIKSALRNRGTIWHIGDNGKLYVRGLVYSSSREPWICLGGECRIMATSIPKKSDSSWVVYAFNWVPKEESYSFGETLVGDWSFSGGHKWKCIDVNFNCQGIWALPGNSEFQVNVYAAKGDTIVGYIDERNILKDVIEFTKSWNTVSSDQPKGYSYQDIKVVNSPSIDDHIVSKKHPFLIYVKCNVTPDKSDILVFYDSDDGKTFKYFSLQTPWNGQRFQGIAVDSQYLWVHSKTEIAFVPHGGVMNCINNKKCMTYRNWSRYSFPKELGEIRYLSVCDDGTLTVAVTNGNKIYSATPVIKQMSAEFPAIIYSITIEQEYEDPELFGRKTQTHAWVSDRSAEARFVHKMPNANWQMIEDLQASTQSLKERIEKFKC